MACLLGCAFCFFGHLWAFLLPLAAYLPLHLSAYLAMKRINKGAALNRVLGMTARNMFVYGLSVTLGFLFS